MPFIKKFDDSYSFKIEAPYNDKQYTFFIYLDENILIGYPVDTKDEHTTTQCWAICVNAKHGLMIWDNKNSTWARTMSKMQDAYTSYQAEKILLEGDLCR